MSIFNDLLEKITGLDLDGSSQKTAEHPCSNCPSNCTIAGEACSLCAPFKKKLIDAVYHVDHIDEFRAQYEVVSNPQNIPAGGTITCPRCGGPSANHYVCDYCGAKLSDEPVSSGKIQVSAASEIPNPIMEAQDIIFERYNAIVKKFSAQKSSSGSLIGNLFSELFGSQTDEDSDSLLGKKMSESEIKEAAALYHVSVGDYLNGLDNGKYLNLSAKKSADAQGKSGWSPAGSGMAGMAGIGMIVSELMKDSAGMRRPQERPQRPPQYREPQQFREPQRPQQQNDFRFPFSQDERRPSRPSRQPDPESQIRDPRPSQSRERPDRPVQPRPSDSGRVKPNQSGSSRPSRQNEPERSERWKDRDPGRRRGG